MNILLIGSGGREHALAWAVAKSNDCNNLWCAPGNPGIFSLARKAEVNPSDFEAVATFCNDNSIDLVIVGPEQPLADGIADFLVARGIRVFGPASAAARLESSKGFAKDFMRKYNIPTAAYRIFGDNEVASAHSFVESCHIPLVVKADGLAAGKGVMIADSYLDAHLAIDKMFSGLFNHAGKSIVIEEFMEGEEASILAICDGTDFVTLAPSQDHKRVFDGDRGSNTGGMGTYAPAPIVTGELLARVEEKIIKPTLEGMAAEGTPFVGCLYVGLMINLGEPKVVEYNVRFGDPETQSVLSIFDGDMARLLFSAADGQIDKSAIVNATNGSACCVILASNGYPENYDKGYEILGVKEAEDSGAIVFQAGTAIKDNKLVTSGGRVLGITGKGENLEEAIDKAYEAVNKICYDNIYYRKDIGQKGLRYFMKRT